MSDVNANIGVHIDTSMALAELKNLQRQLAQFHSQVSKTSAAAAAAQKNLQTNLINSINATGKFRAQMGVVRTSTESFTDSLEKNKFSMREYFRYAGGATRTFGRLFKSEFDTIGKVAEERVKRMQTQYIKMGRDANGAMKAIAITPTTLNMKDYSTQTAIAAQKQQLLNQLLKQGSTNLLNFGKNTQWAGRQLMVGFTVPLAYFGTAAAKTFMDLEAQALKFRRVYGDMFTTTAEADKALGNIQDLAKEFTKYGVAVTDTMKMAADAAAMGKTGAELTAQVANATRLAVLGNVEQQQALDTTISLTNAFGIAAEDLTSKINFLNAVENQTVTSIEDLTIAVPKAGPVIQQLGGSVEDLAFFLTAMREGGINASEGANALKSGLASLINPTKKASEMFAGMGINIKDIVERNQGNLRQTVIEFAQALDTLDPLNRARGIEQLFGKFQFARLSTLFQNITKDGTQASKVLQMAGASVEELAILSERELKAVEDAVGTNFKEAVEQLKVSIAPIGKEFLKAITPVVKFLGNLLEKFNGLSDGSKKFLVILTTVVGLLGPTLLMTFGLVANGAANIIKMFILMRQGFLKLSGNTSNLAQQTQYMTTEQMEAATVAASLNQSHARLTQQFALEAEAVRLLRNAYIEATSAAAKFASANPGMMIPGAGRIPGKKFASGTTEVVGGQAGKDSVPSLLMPGEAVVPTKIAQDERFKPLIAALVSGDIAKYGDGTTNAGSDKVFAHSVSPIELRGMKASQRSKDFGFTREKLYTAIGFDLDKDINQKLLSKKPNVSLGDYRRAVQDKESLRTMTARLIESGIPPRQAHAITKEIRNNFLKSTAGLPDNTLINDDWVYRRMGTDKTGIIGALSKSKNPVVAAAMKELYFGGSKSMGGTTTLEKAFNNIRKSNPGATMALASIDDILRAVSGKLGKNGIDPLDSLKKLYPDIELPVIKDSKGNIIGYQRPELHSDGVLSKNKFNIGLLRDGKFETERALGSSNRQIKIKDWSSRAYDKLIGKKVAVKPGQKAIDLDTGAAVPPKRVKLTTADKRRIPASQRLAHTKALMLRAGQGIPALRATAQDGEINGNSYTKTESGLLVPQSAIEKQTQALIDNTQSQNKGTDTQEKSTKEVKRDQRAARAQRVGAYSGPVAMAAGTAGMVAAMAGAPQTMTNFLFGVSAVSGLLPLLANPLGAVIASIAALGLAFYKFNSDLKKATQEGANFAKSMTMTNSKLIELSKVTGTVSATEEAKRKRETVLTGASGIQRKTGQTILESGVGKGILADIEAQKKSGASNADIAKSIGVGLSTAIMQGVLTTEQAKSLAAALGEKLGSYDIPARISGTIVSLVGPNGERLESEPLQVALNIKKQSMEQQAKVFQNAISQRKSQNTAGNTALTIGGIAAGAMAVTAATGGLAGPAALAVSIAALGKAAWDQNKAKAANLKLDTAAIQLGLEAVSQGQGLLDSLNKQYDNKLKQAKTEAEIAQIEKDRKDAIDAVNKENAKTLDILLQQKDQFTSGAFDAAIKAAADTMYKEGPMAVFKDEAINALNGLENTNFKTTLQLGFASGEMDPNQIIALINMASKNKDIQQNIDLIVKQQGMAEANVLIGLLEKAGANESTYKIITNLVKGDPKQFKDVQDALGALSNILPKYGVTVDINTVGLKQLQQIQRITNTLKNEKGPITKEIIAKYAKDPNNPDQSIYQGILDTWTTLVGSSDTITKEMIIDFSATYSDPNVKDFLNTSKGLDNVPQHIKDLMGGTSAEASAYLIGTGKGSQAAGKKTATTTDTTDTGTRDTTLDDLLKRLKFIGDAAINAEGEVKELIRITSGKGITKFAGVMQQLMAGPKGGFNREFISFLEQMDNATRAIYMTEKKGKVILTEKGKALKEAFDEKTIREYQVTQAQSIQDTLAQRAAFLRLRAAGVDNATALEMVADASLAVAINSKDITSAEIAKMGKDAKEAAKQISILNLELKNAAEASRKDIKGLEETLSALQAATSGKLAFTLGKDFLNLTKEQLALIANDKTLATSINQLFNFQGNPAELKQLVKDVQDMLSNANLSVTIGAKIQFEQDPVAALQSQFDSIGSNIEKYFSNLRLIQESIFKPQIAVAEAAVKTAENNVDRIQKELDIIQQSIDDQQRSIELEITRKVDDYQEQINDLQRQIELQFDRPISALQNESSALSEDLTLIDKAAESINKKYDDQFKALNKIQEVNQTIIDQQKKQIGLADALSQGDISAAAQAMQEMRSANAAAASSNVQDILEVAKQAELDNLRSKNGLTRLQITDRQYQIERQIYALNQDKQKIESDILIKQDLIYALEEKREEKLLAIRNLEDQIYNRTNLQTGDLYKANQQLTIAQNSLNSINIAYNNAITAIEAQETQWLAVQAGIAAAENSTVSFIAMLNNATAAALALAAAIKSGSSPKSVTDTTDNGSKDAKDAEDAKNKANQALIDQYNADLNEWNAQYIAAQTEKNTNDSWLLHKNADLSKNPIISQWDKRLQILQGYDPIKDFLMNNPKPTPPVLNKSAGGLIAKYFAEGGMPNFKPLGTDTVPAMLSPGEFVMSRYAVDTYGLDKMKSINSGTYSSGSVYNYSVNVNVDGTDSNADDIAKVVIRQIQQLDNQRLRKQAV